MKTILIPIIMALLVVGCKTGRNTSQEWFELGIKSVNNADTLIELEEGEEYFKKAENNYYLWGKLALDLYYSDVTPAQATPGCLKGLSLVRKNHKEGINTLKSAAEEGDPHAQLYYGFILYHGLDPSCSDREKGLQYIKQAAESKIPGAGFFYAYTEIAAGEVYLIPHIGFKEDNLERVLSYLLQDAEKGYAPAQCILAHVYYTMDEKYRADFTRGALYYWEEAAKQNYPPALFFKGIMHSWGKGYERDKGEGGVFIKVAADHDFAPAQYYYPRR